MVYINQSKTLQLKDYKTNIILWMILVFTNLVDIMYTYYVFSKDGIECNPILIFMCSKFGNISIAFFKGFLLGFLFLLLPFIRGWLQKLLFFPCLVYCILIITYVFNILVRLFVS